MGALRIKMEIIFVRRTGCYVRNVSSWKKPKGCGGNIIVDFMGTVVLEIYHSFRAPLPRHWLR